METAKFVGSATLIGLIVGFGLFTFLMVGTSFRPWEYWCEPGGTRIVTISPSRETEWSTERIDQPSRVEAPEWLSTDVRLEVSQKFVDEVFHRQGTRLTGYFPETHLVCKITVAPGTPEGTRGRVEVVRDEPPYSKSFYVRVRSPGIYSGIDSPENLHAALKLSFSGAVVGLIGSTVSVIVRLNQKSRQ